MGTHNTFTTWRPSRHVLHMIVTSARRDFASAFLPATATGQRDCRLRARARSTVRRTAADAPWLFPEAHRVRVEHPGPGAGVVSAATAHRVKAWPHTQDAWSLANCAAGHQLIADLDAGQQASVYRDGSDLVDHHRHRTKHGVVAERHPFQARHGGGGGAPVQRLQRPGVAHR